MNTETSLHIDPSQRDLVLSLFTTSPYLHDWQILPVITLDVFQVLLEKLNSTELSARS